MDRRKFLTLAAAGAGAALCGADFWRSQYSIALTSWLVCASMFLICSASRSENAFSSFENSPLDFREKGLSSRIPRSAASASSQASSMRTR